MKIDLPLFDRDKKRWRVVEAEIVDVAPHLSGTFAVHRCPWSADIGSKSWKVTNVETGTWITTDLYETRSRKGCIEAVRAILAWKSDEEYQRAARSVDRKTRSVTVTGKEEAK